MFAHCDRSVCYLHPNSKIFTPNHHSDAKVLCFYKYVYIEPKTFDLKHFIRYVLNKFFFKFVVA